MDISYKSLVFLATCVLLSSCGSDEGVDYSEFDDSPPQPKIRPAPNHEWNEFGDLNLRKGYPNEADIHFGLENGMLEIRGDHRVEEKTTITVLDQEYTVSKKISEKIQIPICDRLGNLKLDKVFNQYDRRPNTRVDLNLEVSVKLPNREPLKVKVPPLIRGNSDGLCLLRIKNGPLLFVGEESNEPTEPYSATYVNSTNYVFAVGEAKVLSDVDLVAFVKTVQTGRTRRCSYLTGDMTMHITNAKLTIYERRTGKALPGAKTIGGNSSCPRVMYATQGQTSMGSGYDTRSINNWIKGQLRSYAAKAKRRQKQTSP